MGVRSSPNVLLIVMDSVRAQNTSIHGYERETTPFLSKFATEAVNYTQARAPGPNTITSSTSIFTGLDVPEHRHVWRNERVDPEQTIWHELSEGGYRTAVFSSNTLLAQADCGLKDGFDEVYPGRKQQLPFPSAVDPREFQENDNRQYADFLRTAVADGQILRSLLNASILEVSNSRFSDLIPDRMKPVYRDSIYTDLFLEWVENSDGPWAACVNLMDAHIPYEPDPEHDVFTRPDESWDRIADLSRWDIVNGDATEEELSVAENLYDGCIRQVDAEIASLVAGLKKRGEYDNTLLIVTSDHGEAFGEPSTLRDCDNGFHGITGGLHEVIVHVPLVVKPPGQFESTVISEVVSLTEFPRVVRDALDRRGIPDFRTGGPVYAHTPPVRPGYPEEKVDDPRQLTAWMDAKYRMEGDQVVKYAQWRDNQSVVHCHDAQTRVVRPEGDRAPFDIERPSERSGIKTSKQGDTAMPDTVQARLEELGYL